MNVFQVFSMFFNPTPLFFMLTFSEQCLPHSLSPTSTVEHVFHLALRTMYPFGQGRGEAKSVFHYLIIYRIYVIMHNTCVFFTNLDYMFAQVPKIPKYISKNMK